MSKSGFWESLENLKGVRRHGVLCSFLLAADRREENRSSTYVLRRTRSLGTYLRRYNVLETRVRVLIFGVFYSQSTEKLYLYHCSSPQKSHVGRSPVQRRAYLSLNLFLSLPISKQLSPSPRLSACRNRSLDPRRPPDVRLPFPFRANGILFLAPGGAASLAYREQSEAEVK